MPLAPVSPCIATALEVPKAAAAETEDAEMSSAARKAARKARREAVAAEAEAAAKEELEEPPAKRQKGKKAKALAEGEASAEAADVDALSPEDFRKKFHISSLGESSSLPDPVQRFEDAPFSKKLKTALLGAGFAQPSPIQAQGWPLAVQGHDLVAVAKTGSGKTLGFLLPAFRMISKAAADAPEPKGPVAEPSVLVLAPTRELASQIEVECGKFGQHANVRSLAVFGGVPKGPQVKACKEQPQVLIATPGRLQDLMEMKVVSLKNVRFLVLDEADRMLDMGFEPEIAKIFAETPEGRQTLLFSATWPKSVQKIAATYLKKDHTHVNVGETEELAANKAVAQEFFAIGDDEKEMKLWRLIADLPDNAKLIAFMNTKRRVTSLTKAFWARGFEVAELHGDRTQQQRDQDLAKFASGKVWLLFATDVCARGLDIKDVTHVVNFDMARDVESYVHRIGRTGRAGSTGKSITFWNEAYDMECSPALAKIAQEAGQEVPAFLQKAADKQKVAKTKQWKY